MRCLIKMTTARYEQATSVLCDLHNLLFDKEALFVITVDEDCPNDIIDFYNTMGWKVDMGTFENKVQAINSGNLLQYAWDILINLSDDQVFRVEHFDKVIVDEFGTEPLFLHLPDGNRKDFSTLSIMNRAYYELDEFVYDPRFNTMYCDNWATMVAKKRGMYRFKDVLLFEHRHHAFRKGKIDWLYLKNNDGFAEDKKMFSMLKAELL